MFTSMTFKQFAYRAISMIAATTTITPTSVNNVTLHQGL